jgi:hypothetical protein
VSFVASSIVSLSDVRAHLRIPSGNTDDDDMLTDIFIPAADRVVQRECNEQIATEWDEFYDGGDLSIWLRHIPILSVELVEEGWGWTNYTLNYVQVNDIIQNEESIDPIFAYSIDIPEEGCITRRYGGNVPAPFVQGEGNIHVVYTSGVETVPGNVVLAELELIAHWYQGAMQRHSGTANVYDAVAEDYARSGANPQELTSFGVPERIIELLKPDRRTPIIG